MSIDRAANVVTDLGETEVLFYITTQLTVAASSGLGLKSS